MKNRNTKGQFSIGNPGKPKGSMNKISMDLRRLISNFLNDNFEAAIMEFNKIDSPEKKVKLYIELLSFALPRLRANESTSELGNLTEKELDYIIKTLKNERDEAIRQAQKN